MGAGRQALECMYTLAQVATDVMDGVYDVSASKKSGVGSGEQKISRW